MKEEVVIDNNDIKIPAILWGKSGKKVIIAVHGDMSHKEDTVITLLARHANPKGYHVLSFDLPEHGDRKNDNYECNPPNCISDLKAVYAYAQSLGVEISLFACSIGAYFSLLAFQKSPVYKSLFLSPVVNMEHVIHNMMIGFQVSEQRLKKEQKILLPIGKTLDWDYYMYVKQHPVDFKWDSPVTILYGSKDTLSAKDDIDKFTEKYKAKLTVMKNAEHFFHTEEQLVFYEKWLDENLMFQ